jgi:DNA-directed RNA polymerase specialized sigma subunit
MAGKKKTTKFQPHRILREVYRHYYEFEALVAAYGTHTIDHAVRLYDEEGNELDRIPVTISFFDLRDGLRPQSEGGVLSDRKLQAVMLNVIRDMKQRDVAEAMGITTVSVGQYVEHAMEQLAKTYFPEFYEDKVTA